MLKNINFYSTKKREGIVDKKIDDHEIIVKNMFNKKTDFAKFIGKEILLEK